MFVCWLYTSIDTHKNTKEIKEIIISESNSAAASVKFEYTSSHKYIENEEKRGLPFKMEITKLFSFICSLYSFIRP